MDISFWVSDEEAKLINKYIDVNKISVQDFVRRTVIERIEDEFDLAVMQKAEAVCKENPEKYSLDEIKKELKV